MCYGVLFSDIAGEMNGSLGRFFVFLGELYLKSPELYRGKCEIIYSHPDSNTLVIRRSTEDGREIIGIFNFSGTRSRVVLPLAYDKYREIFASGESAYESAVLHREGGRVRVSVDRLSALLIAPCEK